MLDKSGGDRCVHLTYTLTYDEALEAFLFVSLRGSERLRRFVCGALIALTAVLVALYGRNPDKLEYFVLPLLTLATYCAVVWCPRHRAKKGARGVARAKGTYRVALFDDGYIQPHGEGRIPLKGDKSARGCETQASFIIRPDRLHTICLPKREMRREDASFVRDVLRANLTRFSSG